MSKRAALAELLIAAQRARDLILSERGVLIHSFTNLRTGEVAREAEPELTQYDDVLAGLNAGIKTAKRAQKEKKK